MTTEERARLLDMQQQHREFIAARGWRAREPHNKKAGVDAAKSHARHRRNRRRQNAWLREWRAA